MAETKPRLTVPIPGGRQTQPTRYRLDPLGCTHTGTARAKRLMRTHGVSRDCALQGSAPPHSAPRPVGPQVDPEAAWVTVVVRARRLKAPDKAMVLQETSAVAGPGGVGWGGVDCNSDPRCSEAPDTTTAVRREACGGAPRFCVFVRAVTTNLRG